MSPNRAIHSDRSDFLPVAAARPLTVLTSQVAMVVIAEGTTHSLAPRPRGTFRLVRPARTRTNECFEWAKWAPKEPWSESWLHIRICDRLFSPATQFPYPSPPFNSGDSAWPRHARIPSSSRTLVHYVVPSSTQGGNRHDQGCPGSQAPSVAWGSFGDTIPNSEKIPLVSP